jgi:CHAT domain-containing protein
MQRAIGVLEAKYDPEAPELARALTVAARVAFERGEYDRATELFTRVERIVTSLGIEAHPEVTRGARFFAKVLESRGEPDRALEILRRATRAFSLRAQRQTLHTGGRSERSLARQTLVDYVDLLFKLAEKEPSAAPDLEAEAFGVLQLGYATAAAEAIGRMAARFATGEGALANLVRRREDAVERWRWANHQLAGRLASSTSTASQPLELASQIVALEKEVAQLDREIATDAPQYQELIGAPTITLGDAQRLLRPNEALMAFMVGADATHLWVLRSDRAKHHRIEGLGREALEKAVANLRLSLDPIGVRTLEDIPAFDTTRAFQLYQMLFQPAGSLLKGVRHVFVVPDGALQSLPLGVLVTEKPQGSFTDFAGYRHVPWLARKYAMTTLPSVSSLRALRTFAQRTKASQPFFGVGDPKLKGKTGSGRGVKLASLFTARGVADVDLVRQLASLPETAGELKAMARTLGASDEALLLGTEATETRVKQARLEDYKVLAFATHGLVAGDLTGLSEPALVLTPPEEGTELDDGLLTASEIAQLKLDADWVILSACNTAAADGTPGAEGLSGLAKAFFYAGSRALLVSHWPVVSDAAVQITTRMLEEARKPGVGRALVWSARDYLQNIFPAEPTQSLSEPTVPAKPDGARMPPAKNGG